MTTDPALREALAREIYARTFAADDDRVPRHGYANWDSGSGHPYFESGFSVAEARRLADAIRALAEERERHLGLLWFAWSEFNAIRARHGAPITRDGMHTCAPDWWDAMTEAFAEAIGEDAQKPWPGERTKAIAVELAAKMEAARHE